MSGISVKSFLPDLITAMVLDSIKSVSVVKYLILAQQSKMLLHSLHTGSVKSLSISTCFMAAALLLVHSRRDLCSTILVLGGLSHAAKYVLDFLDFASAALSSSSLAV